MEYIDKIFNTDTIYSICPAILQLFCFAKYFGTKEEIPNDYCSYPVDFA